MKRMKIFGYVLLMILIALTIFNFMALFNSKKRKMTGKMTYQATIWPIEKKLMAYMKERALDFTIVQRMVNDLGDGIIFVADPKNRKAAVAMANDMLTFSYDELEAAERYYDLEGKKTVAAYVVLTVNGTMYRYDIATKRFNPKGLVGKVLYDTTEEFYSKAHAILEENKKGEGKS